MKMEGRKEREKRGREEGKTGEKKEGRIWREGRDGEREGGRKIKWL